MIARHDHNITVRGCPGIRMLVQLPCLAQPLRQYQRTHPWRHQQPCSALCPPLPPLTCLYLRPLALPLCCAGLQRQRGRRGGVVRDGVRAGGWVHFLSIVFRLIGLFVMEYELEGAPPHCVEA